MDKVALVQIFLGMVFFFLSLIIPLMFNIRKHSPASLGLGGQSHLVIR